MMVYLSFFDSMVNFKPDPFAIQVKNFTRPLKFLETVKVLLNAKVQLDAKDENCCTALHRTLVEREQGG